MSHLYFTKHHYYTIRVNTYKSAHTQENFQDTFFFSFYLRVIHIVVQVKNVYEIEKKERFLSQRLGRKMFFSVSYFCKQQFTFFK